MFRPPAVDQLAALTGVLIAGLAAPMAPAQTRPDNTRVNKQDRSPSEVTADRQGENRTDRYLTQQIRKAVVADRSLSSDARSVKIVSQGGAVTLRGLVRSEEEKKAIVAKAEQIAGSGKATDELSVKSTQ